MTNGLVIKHYDDAATRDAVWTQWRREGKRHVIRWRGDDNATFYVAYSRPIELETTPIVEAMEPVESRAHIAVEELETLPQ